jgi:hypothetical protein
MKRLTTTPWLPLVSLVIATLALAGVRTFGAGNRVTCNPPAEIIFGCDNDPADYDAKTVRKILKLFSPDCYKVKFWKDHHQPDNNGGDPVVGNLGDISCAKKRAVQRVSGDDGRPGSQVTQRVMFSNGPELKKFIRKLDTLSR